MLPIRSYCLGFLILLLPVLAHAEAVVGQVVFAKGSAHIQHISSPVKPATFGEDVYQMDTLQTGDGELRVLFNDKTLLSLAPQSKILITEHVYNPNQGIRRSLFDIVRGTVRAIVDQPSALKENDIRLQTPTAVAGIRGTDAGVQVIGIAARFVCFSGLFDAFAKTNPSGRVAVKTGEWTEIHGPVPTPPAPITADILRPFSDVLSSKPLKDVLHQTGGASLQSPPPAPATTTSPPSPQEEPAAPPPQQQPTTPPVVPGGTTNTPSNAGSGGTAPVSVPLTFPS